MKIPPEVCRLAASCTPLLRLLMSSGTKNREVAYTRAIQICQNLTRLAVYELIGGQILLPKEEGAHHCNQDPWCCCQS